jgi:DNA-binding PadR family transcriptional regulator
MNAPIRMTTATLDVLEEFVFNANNELYGLRIAQTTGLLTGTVYPILARLEQIGWIESRWESDETQTRGPRRRFYRLTPSGLVNARTALAGRRSARRRRPRLAPGLSSLVTGV